MKRQKTAWAEVKSRRGECRASDLSLPALPVATSLSNWGEADMPLAVDQAEITTVQATPRDGTEQMPTLV